MHRAIPLGDATMSVLDIWGAEYQENDALLVAPEREPLLRAIAQRERCPVAVIGAVGSSGRIVLVDPLAPPGSPTPEDLELDKVLGALPQKSYDLRRAPRAAAAPVHLPAALGCEQALRATLRLLAVGSKRFLTNKVDRSVTGLVARQQCCGPFQLPVADCAVLAQSFSGVTGAATAVGEQPLKGLLSPAAMARLALGEALTNLVFAPVSALHDVKASGNWMYAAKLPGEGADMYDACVAMRDAMLALGVAVDGGKDSLSMAAAAPGEPAPVRAPGQLVVSLYAFCPDITKVVTPDLKRPGSPLFLLDLGGGRRRLGGSAMLHGQGQVGVETPDMDSPLLLKRAFEATQTLISQAPGAILSGHDVSDGGLATALLEMAFAGGLGLDVALPAPPAADAEAAGGGARGAALAAMFAEELGLVLEVAEEHEAAVAAAYAAAGVPLLRLGASTADGGVAMRLGSLDAPPLLTAPMTELRDVWEETSFALERLQSSPATVAAEQAGLRHRRPLAWTLPYAPPPAAPAGGSAPRPRVAVLREEGTNGDREMAAALHAAGFEPWDVSMSDLVAGRAQLSAFRGLVFAGGFSFADVLDSAKGWAATIRYNQAVQAQFAAFRARRDTFSLGVCNGCQLMALLGWVPGGEAQAAGEAAPLLPSAQQPRFVHNASGRFESRFVTVRVLPGSPAMMLKGMEGLVCGVWSAHGEGRLLCPDAAVAARIQADALAPLRYVDDAGEATEEYPANPNGSPGGAAALCSPDGRHLAMMPHPERAFLHWQMPWVPAEAAAVMGPKTAPSPWLKLFQNAYEWCNATSQ